jgi:hypothetical protein
LEDHRQRNNYKQSLRTLRLCGELFKLSDDFSRIARNDRIRRDVFGYNAAGSYYGSGTYGDAAEDGGVGADGSSLFDHRRDYLPVLFGLKSAGFTDGPGVAVVDKHHAVADKDLVFDGDTLADKGMALDFAVFADEGVFLDLHKRPNPGTVIDRTAIEVDKVV